MSDPLEGGSGSDGPKVSAEIEFIVKGINQAVAVVKAASAAMEKDVANFDKTIGLVNNSLKLLGVQSKAASQIASQNFRLAYQNNNTVAKQQQNIHAQQMQAARMTAATQRQNHQAAMANLRAQAQAARAATGGGGGGGLSGIGRILGGLTGGGGGLGAAIGGIAGGFVGGALASSISSTTNAIIQGVTAADELARAYERQNLAGRTLAGTQADLNNLLEVYDQATGEALSKSKQMANVVRLQAVGFADSEQELEQFSKAIRGISLAIGEPADYVTQNLILELFSQRGQRLDQLGLQYDNVRQRQEELMNSDRNLTKQQAYQQAVLDQALDRYGALSESTEGQATGVERLSAAWSDFGLAISMLITGPLDGLLIKLAEITDAVSGLVGKIATVDPDDIKYPTPPGGINTSVNTPESMISYGESRDLLNRSLERKAKLLEGGILASMQSATRSALGMEDNMAEIDALILQARRNMAAIDVARMRERGYRDPTPGGGTYDDRPKPFAFTPDQEEEVRSFSIARAQIESDTNAAILEENTEYKNRRIEIEQDYQRQVSEEAEDFARKRARDEAEFAKDIAKVQADSAENQLEIQEDLAKSIAKANRDHARDLEKWERDHGRSLQKLREDAAEDEEDVQEDLDDKNTEARKDSAEKITEMEEEFGRDRAKAAKAHNETILQAASRLDAAAVYWEQRKYAREKKEAQEEQDRKIAKEKETLEEELAENDTAAAERLADIRENLAEQVAEENEAYQLRVADANEAHAQQLADQQAAAAERLAEVVQEDADRLAEMIKGHAERLSQEDIDRGIRLGREKTQHDDQITELDRVHGLRITQIGNQAQAERDKLDEEHRQKMLDLGFQNGQWMEADRRARNIALKEHELFLKQDAQIALQARKRELESKLRDPSLSTEDKINITKVLGYITDENTALQTSIDNLVTEIANLPKPQTDLLPSSPRSGETTVQGKSSGVDLGVWDGKVTTSTDGMVTGAGAPVTSNVVFKVEAGAITITPLPGQSAASVGDDFENRLLTVLRKVAKVG